MSFEFAEVEAPEDDDGEDLVFAKTGRWATQDVVYGEASAAVNAVYTVEELYAYLSWPRAQHPHYRRALLAGRHAQQGVARRAGRIGRLNEQ